MLSKLSTKTEYMKNKHLEANKLLSVSKSISWNSIVQILKNKSKFLKSKFSRSTTIS